MDDGGLRDADPDTDIAADRPEAPAPTTTSTTLGEGTMVLTPVPGDDTSAAGPDATDGDTGVVVDPGGGGATPPPAPHANELAVNSLGAGNVDYGRTRSTDHNIPKEYSRTLLSNS